MKPYGTQFINVEAMNEKGASYVVVDIGNRISNQFMSILLTATDARQLAAALLEHASKAQPDNKDILETLLNKLNKEPPQ